MTQLRFLERTPSLLEAHELEDVYSQDPQPSVVPGVDRAIRLGEAADDVMRRNRLTGTSEHLVHIGARRPFIVPYLTMPTGCAVGFDQEGAIVFPSNEDTGRRDPVYPYDFGPASVTT